MNKIVPNTWAPSKLRDLGVLQYSMSGQDQGVYNSLFLLLSLFSMPHFLQKVNPDFWAGQDLRHVPARMDRQNLVTDWGSSLQISLEVLLRLLTPN